MASGYMLDRPMLESLLTTQEKPIQKGFLLPPPAPPSQPHSFSTRNPLSAQAKRLTAHGKKARASLPTSRASRGRTTGVVRAKPRASEDLPRSEGLRESFGRHPHADARNNALSDAWHTPWGRKQGGESEERNWHRQGEHRQVDQGFPFLFVLHETLRDTMRSCFPSFRHMLQTDLHADICDAQK